MCVYSMVADHFYDKWKNIPPEPPKPFPSKNPWDYEIPVLPSEESPLSEKELRDLRDLLKRAKKYDKEHNQPDCELEDKKKKLIELARVLGFKLWFDEEDELKWELLK